MPESAPAHAPNSPGDGESRFFGRLAERVLDHRALAVALVVALTGLFGWGAQFLVIDNSPEAFLSADSEAREVLERLRDDFGRDDAFLVLAEGDVFTKAYLDRVRALEADIEALSLDLPSLGQRKRHGRPAGEVTPAAAPDQAAPAPAPPPGQAAPVPSAPSGQAAPEPSAPTAPAAPTEDEFGFVEAPPSPAQPAGTDKDSNTAAPSPASSPAAEEAGAAAPSDERPVVEEVISLASVRETRWRDGGLDVGGLFDGALDDAAIRAKRNQVLADRTLVGQVVGREGRHSVLVVRTGFLSEADSARVHFALADLVGRHAAPDFKLHIAGSPALGAELNDLMLRDLAVMFVLAVAFILAIMTWQFRHPIGVFGPLAVVVLALGWTFGTMALAGAPMTLVTNVLPAFIVCAAIGDAVHIISVYRDLRSGGLENRAAIVKALAVTGVPVVYTSLTTFAGLISFRGASLDAIRDMGTFGALGVLYALFLSVVLVPVILSWNTRSLLGLRAAAAADGQPARRDRIDAFLGLASHLAGSPSARDPRPSRRRAALVLGLVGGLLVASVWGGTLLRLHHEPVAWLPEEAPARVAIEAVNQNLGGTSTIALLIHAPEGQSLRSLAHLRRLEALERHILDFEHPEHGRIIGNATSILDVVRESWRAFHGMVDAWYRLPPDDRGVADMLLVFESRGPAELKRLVTVDYRTAVMTVRVAQLDAWAYKPLTEHITRGIASHMDGQLKVEVTGTVFNLFTVASELLENLLVSFGWAFAIITALMLVLLRDLKLGLLSMIPNLLPIANVIGFMGVLDIPIDIGTLLIASIALGIAVDDTIHFFYHFQARYRADGDVEAAIAHTLGHSGRAMIATSIILMGGFLVYTAATMANLQRFGLLIALTVAFALLYDLIVSPALLRLALGKKVAAQTIQTPAVP